MPPFEPLLEPLLEDDDLKYLRQSLAKSLGVPRKYHNAPVIDEDLLQIPSQHKPTLVEKYGYENPLVIKMTNINNSGDVRIFMSVKDICEKLSIKSKKIYCCLNSENKILNSIYKL